METYASILLKNMNPCEMEKIEQGDSQEHAKYKTLLMNHPNIKLTDTLDGLENYSFIECAGETNPTIKASRGIVFAGEKMICRSFPYTVSYSTNQKEEILNFFSDLDFSQVLFFPSYEGTIVRVFHHGDEENGKWYISTNRRLDADTCNWGPDRETFGSKFRKGVPENFLDTLEKGRTYFFLIENNMKSRLVCQVDSPKVYFVGSIFQGKFSIENVKGFESQALKFDSYKHVIEIASGMTWKSYQGIIAFCPGFIQVKIQSEEYTRRYNLRNNAPNILSRYLELKDSKYTEEDRQLYREMYFEHISQFDEYERYIDIISTNLLGLYNSRYIQHRFVKTEPQKHYVIKTAFEEAGFGKDAVDVKNIKSILLRQNSWTLSTMIKEVQRIRQA
jgi:hypothetical protein